MRVEGIAGDSSGALGVSVLVHVRYGLSFEAPIFVKNLGRLHPQYFGSGLPSLEFASISNGMGSVGKEGIISFPEPVRHQSRNF